MRLSKTTLLHLRSAILMLLTALDAALLEGYGWTPRGSKQNIDTHGILDTDMVR